MRILLSILMFITGAGLIAYSWVGGLVEVATELETAVDANEASSAIAKIFHIITTGELPQLTTFFYIGVLVIVVSIFYLVGLFGKKRTQQVKD